MISADHGLAIVYFLQSEVVNTMLASGVQVVLLTDEALLDKIQERFGRAGAGGREPAPQAGAPVFPERAQFAAMVAGFLPPRRRLQAHEPGDGEQLCQLGEDRSPRQAQGDLPPGARRGGGDAPLVSRPARPGQAPTPVYPQYLQRPVRALPTRPGGCQHGRLAHGPLPAARGAPPERAHGCHRPGVG